MAKTGKTDKKVKKADKKTARKCGRKCGALVALIAVSSAIAAGCASTGAQPSRSQTQNSDFRDCIVIVAARASVSNTTVVATSEDGMMPIELFTQTMRNEGSESNNPTAKPSATTDISPKTDVNTTGGRSAGVLESVVGAFGTWLTTDSGKAAVSSAATTTSSNGSCSEGSCSDCSLK